MFDMLRETRAFQEIIKEGREAERQERLQDHRRTLISFVQIRFPELAPLAKKQADAINDPEVLQSLILEMFSMQTLEEAGQHLLKIGKESEKK